MLFGGSEFSAGVELTEENVDTDEGNQGTLSNEVFDANTGADAGDDELADRHANCTEQEEWARTQASTMYNPGNVLATFTAEVIMLTVNELLIPDRLKKDVR